MVEIITCVGCGCDDNHACPTGCGWHFVSGVHPDLGICTVCAAEIGDEDPEALIAAAVDEWQARSQELAADRADAGDLILPDHPDFYETLNQRRAT